MPKQEPCLLQPHLVASNPQQRIWTYGGLSVRFDSVKGDLVREGMEVFTELAEVEKRFEALEIETCMSVHSATTEDI